MRGIDQAVSVLADVQRRAILAANPYPHHRTCANCGRRANNLFWHPGDDAFYCTDVFACEERFVGRASEQEREEEQR
jgi:hypothetical protein